MHDTAATHRCMNMYVDNLLKPIEYQGHRFKRQGHMGFLWISGLHDTCRQYLALSEGFTCCVMFFVLKWD